MNTKTKVLVALMAVIVVGGTLVLLPASAGDQQPQAGAQDGLMRLKALQLRNAVMGYLIKNGSAVEVQGTVTFAGPRILVIETASGEINVVIPPRWLMGGTNMTSSNLFDGDPWGVGSSVTLKTLKAEKAFIGYTVKIYFAYEIGRSGVVARALIPFNIEAP
jgi:hypothetical protein